MDLALAHEGYVNVRLSVAVPAETSTALKEVVGVGLSVQRCNRALLVLPYAFPFLLLEYKENRVVWSTKSEAVLP